MAALRLCLLLVIFVSVNSLEINHAPRVRRNADAEKLAELTTHFFTSADSDDDGFLTFAEFSSSFMDLDTDSDGEISLAEYVAHLTSAQFPVQLAPTQEGQAAIAAKIFTMGDRNNSGTITSDEITRVFGAIDANDDDLVSEAEYHGAWVHRRAQHGRPT